MTANELQASIKSFQNNKATGLDNIPIETWKTGCMNKGILSVQSQTKNSKIFSDINIFDPNLFCMFLGFKKIAANKAGLAETKHRVQRSI